MKNILKLKCNGFVVLFFLLAINTAVVSQNTSTMKSKNDFWKDVQFGGGLGLAFGNGFTNVAVAPSAIYNFNQYVSAGIGLHYSYLEQRNLFSSNMYGGSLIGLINPVKELQFSVELEQLRVNVKNENTNITDNFWNTGLFLGAGYRTNNVTVGARYNVLFDKDRNVYGDAFMPFVRVYF
jgi:hypothetical protein